MIYCVGNNNYDIFFESGSLTSGSPGGSMLNVAVSLGRMNLPVSFLSRMGDDKLAGFIKSFLKDNNVLTDHVVVMKGKKTSLALAILDDNKRPEYSFYGSAEPPVHFEDIRFSQGDILIFGSSYAIQDSTYETVDEILIKSGKQEALKIYDPNIRKKCLSGFSDSEARALRRIGQADIVKMSNEDLEAIETNTEELINKFPEKPFIITQGSKDVIFRKGKLQIPIKVPSLKPVNTTGAGDAFNAGLVSVLHAELKGKTKINYLPDDFWKRAIERGIQTSAKVCMSKENFIPK